MTMNGSPRSSTPRSSDGATHWSVRAWHEQSGVSKSTVQRWFSLFAIAALLHALQRPLLRREGARYRRPLSQPARPRGCVSTRKPRSRRSTAPNRCCHGAGLLKAVTHDYVRHGTTTPSPPSTPDCHHPCKKRHRHRFSPSYATFPEPFDVHLIADNYATHKHPKVARKATAIPHPLHTHLCLVAQPGRARNDHSNGHLFSKNKIDLFVHRETTTGQSQAPFMWATADSILAKVQRLLLPQYRSSGSFSAAC